MTFKFSPCVLTLHQEETYVSVRPCLVFWSVVVLHTPAYFPFHHLLFGSWESWWVASSAWVRLMWKRPMDQEETCGCERQMPGRTVLRTESNLAVYTVCAPPPLPRGKTTWEVAYLPDGWCVSGTICSVLGRGLWIWKTGAFVFYDVVYWHQPYVSWAHHYKCGVWRLLLSTSCTVTVIELCGLSKTLLHSCPLPRSSLGLQHGCLEREVIFYSPEALFPNSIMPSEERHEDCWQDKNLNCKHGQIIVVIMKF